MTFTLRTHESREIPIGLLTEPRRPSRSTMEGALITELANDIRAKGVLQHLIVFPVDDRYEIAAGHRRFLASKLAGLATVPCDVYVNRADAMLAIQYSENRFREDLAVTDEAILFDDLLSEQFGGDVDALAGYFNVTRAYVDDRLALFRGDPAVFAALQDGHIGAGVAKQLNRIDAHDYRRHYLDQAIQHGATVAIASGYVQEYERLHRPPASPSPASSAATAPTPLPADDYWRCACCGSRELTANMRSVQIHDFCVVTKLKPALAMWENAALYVARPTTREEAAEIINRLAEQFGLVEPADPRRV